jgi:uncharacterized protein (TIGR03086 family)
MADSGPVQQLARAIDQTEAIISGIRPKQADLPTPCSPWDVHALVDHVVRDVQTFTARASRAEGKPGVPGLTGDDWTGEYREAADELLRAWRSEGALEGIIKLPFGELPPTWFLGQQTADLAVHGWDLAKATGQRVEFDEELIRFALEWGKENLRPEFRGKDFGPELPVPEDAPPIDRLVGFFGRRPDWTSQQSAA